MTSSLIHHGNLPMVLLKNYDMGGGENTDDDLMVLAGSPSSGRVSSVLNLHHKF